MLLLFDLTATTIKENIFELSVQCITSHFIQETRLLRIRPDKTTVTNSTEILYTKNLHEQNNYLHEQNHVQANSELVQCCVFQT